MFDETRKRINYYEERIERLKELIEEARQNGEDTTDLQIDLYECESELRIAWADDEAEQNGWR